ncbi:hypothetical protein [Spiroplasma sp. SV19]|uniref:hypothetical protein n=1 Tax=Spiroplasma sp. SV19 TaxID=2570468 RepID=UPI0024B78A36|nr:hypothetical protein [Spiroplasma sp. SV19]WHQ36583.1 hypothetical protein E7Y35_01400 [Spiroplasma sp. SV19]
MNKLEAIIINDTLTVFIKHKVLFKIPLYVIYDLKTNEVLGVGDTSQQFLRQKGYNVRIVKIMDDSRIADETVCLLYFQYVLKKYIKNNHLVFWYPFLLEDKIKALMLKIPEIDFCKNDNLITPIWDNHYQAMIWWQEQKSYLFIRQEKKIIMEKFFCGEDWLFKHLSKTLMQKYQILLSTKAINDIICQLINFNILQQIKIIGKNNLNFKKTIILTNYVEIYQIFVSPLHEIVNDLKCQKNDFFVVTTNSKFNVIIQRFFGEKGITVKQIGGE